MVFLLSWTASTRAVKIFYICVQTNSESEVAWARALLIKEFF